MSNRNRLHLLMLSLAAALLLFARCSKSPSGDDADLDTTPPEAIADLTAIRTTSHTVTLQWTAPYDYRDDHATGAVDGYDLRISYAAITAQNFSAAYRLDSVPAPAPGGLVQLCDIENLEPDSTYYFAVKACDDRGNWSAISNCFSAHCPPIAEVVFADSVLERIVRLHLDKLTGTILSTDVDTIAIIEAPIRGIASLAGLEYFASLQRLVLDRNLITDIAPLAHTTRLWYLDIAQNNVSDLSPLAGLEGLHQLNIGGNPVTNIGPLAAVTNLQQLFIYATPVTDFSPLYNLEHLDDVLMSSMNLSDIGFMSHLTHLRIASLSSNAITSLDALGGLTELQHLDLTFNQVSDLGPLSALPNIVTLTLVSNQITDLQPLVDNPGIDSGDVIYLPGNDLSAEAISVQIPALEARKVVVVQ